MAERLASLPMYDLTEIRPAVEILWDGIGARLRDAGMTGVPPRLTWSGDLYDDHWLHPQLLLSQSCGWPVVDRLDGEVAIVGAFTYAGVSTAQARYRSVLVTRAGDTDRPLTGRRTAVNGLDSLSGWGSLRASVDPLGPVVVTGAHVRSVEAVRTGAADLACIDGVTWALLHRHRPDAVAGLAEAGRGPEIPCLPLVTSRGDDVGALPRRRSAGARSEPLLIDGFVPLDEGDYQDVRRIVEVCRRGPSG